MALAALSGARLLVVSGSVGIPGPMSFAQAAAENGPCRSPRGDRALLGDCGSTGAEWPREKRSNPASVPSGCPVAHRCAKRSPVISNHGEPSLRSETASLVQHRRPPVDVAEWATGDCVSLTSKAPAGEGVSSHCSTSLRFHSAKPQVLRQRDDVTDAIRTRRRPHQRRSVGSARLGVRQVQLPVPMPP